jgi:hypothetical protein
MTQHDIEYRELLTRTLQRDRDSITAHWELGELFARYGEPVTAIARAIERSVTYVADHVAIVRLIPAREDLAVILEDRDDISSWTILVDWVKAGGPGQDSDEEPDAGEVSRRRRNQGGLQLQVPVTVIKGLADLGANPREAMTLFWQNVSPMLIVSVAYPDRVPAAGVSA